MEEAKTLDGQPRRTPRRRGVECWDSRQWNKGGLLPSVAHIHGKRWYKARAEVWRDAAGEVGGGQRTGDHRDTSTRWAGRTSAATVPSGEGRAGTGPDGPTTSIDNSPQLQRRRYRAAQRSRNRRFHALYARIYRPDMLGRAWQEERAQGESAGVDGLSLAEVERQGVAEVLQTLAQDWRTGSDKPPPGRRGYRPKPDGRQRPLGIPTVRDRVVQQACKVVLEPLFEVNFQDHA
jgi:hypothetical protein